jgi:hypothetical protein
MLQKTPRSVPAIPRWAALFGVSAVRSGTGEPVLVASTMAGVVAVPAGSTKITPKSPGGSMSTLITCYDVPADAAPPADGSGQLLRGIDPVKRFAYIEIVDGVPAGTQPRTDGLSGVYEAFHVNSEPAPAFAADGASNSVMFVNCMAFPPENHDAALAVWTRVNAYMVRKPGYRWHRLHRRTHEDAPFGLINVVEWESVAAWQAAHDDGFRALAGGDLPFEAQPTLCLPA